MPPIGMLIEVILYVQDMESQVSFYRDVLGLEVIFPAERKTYRDEYWVTFDAGSCLLALHGGGEGRVGADAPKLVFQVANIQKSRAYLLGNGINIGEVRNAAPGIWVCDAIDPERNKFSIEAQNTEQ